MKWIALLTRAALPFRAALSVSLLLAVSCEKKQTPSAAAILPTVVEVAQQPVAQEPPAEAPPTAPAPQETNKNIVATPEATPNSSTGLRFVAYNVENWLILENRYDYETRVSSKNAPKPEKEKSAVVEILVNARPDAIGVCEIGKKVETPRMVRKRRPVLLLERAVWGMLPKGSLGRQQYTKLKVYAGADHPHAAQQPVERVIA